MENGQHDCDQLALHIAEFVDGGMPKEKEASIIQEVEKCPHCLEKLNLEKGFKSFLLEKINRKPLPSGCLDTIRSQIRSAAGE